MITRLVLDELPPGLNGPEGLIREHFAARKKRKDRYFIKIRSQTLNRHKGSVKITYIRYCNRFMDWDNASASVKLPMDCLKDAKIIIDDSPKIVVEFSTKQVLVDRKSQRIEIIIEDYDNTKE